MSHLRSFLPDCLLLLLSERPGYGLELIDRLRPLGFDWDGRPGPIYAELKTLEEHGLVSSSLDARPRGVARRVYQVTAVGDEALNCALVTIAQLQEQLGVLVQRLEDRGNRLPPRCDDVNPVREAQPSSSQRGVQRLPSMEECPPP